MSNQRQKCSDPLFTAKVIQAERGSKFGEIKTNGRELSACRGNRMIVVANRIRVSEDFEKEFEERFRDRASLLDDCPGFMRNEVLRPVKGEPYIVKTYWADMASFEAWTKSDAFKKAHSNYPPKEMFAGPNALEIHEVLFTTEKS